MHRELLEITQPEANKFLVFQDVMTILRRHYEFTPTAFVTGSGTPAQVENAATANQASCLLLAAARRLGLDPAATLRLYGEHYRDVLADPAGTAHGNIRAFMANGWAGVVFAGDPLRLRGPA